MRPFLTELLVLPVALTGWLAGWAAGSAAGVASLVLTLGLWRGSAPQPEVLVQLALDGLLGAAFGTFGTLYRQLRAQRVIATRAQHDELTGLLKRGAFDERLKLALDEATERGTVLAVLFVDLDRFKFVNDTYGHEVGDELLKAVAEVLRSNVRQHDLIARVGGDEFVLALRNLKEAESAAAVAAKLVKLLGSPFEVCGKLLHISASVGVSLYPEDGKDVASLTRVADSAMYQAKNAGKSGYAFSTQEIEAQEGRRGQLERQLRWALEDGQFEICYQPQIDLKQEALVGFEALLRWNHPELGLISPGEFIPLAEDTGLIVPIGHWLLREVCQQARSWQRAGYRKVKMAVNVSPLQFMQADFAELVLGALRASELEPEWLELEIVESVLMKDVTLAARLLRKLQKLGVSAALDDFGTGYSSLAYLQQLPIETLKIDRSFVSTLTRDARLGQNNTAIIEATCALAHKLGKKVVAEGVETTSQRDFLLELGCDYAQGYFYARPILASEAEVVLRRLPADPAAAPRPSQRPAYAAPLKVQDVRLRMPDV